MSPSHPSTHHPPRVRRAPRADCTALLVLRDYVQGLGVGLLCAVRSLSPRDSGAAPGLGTKQPERQGGAARPPPTSEQADTPASALTTSRAPVPLWAVPPGRRHRRDVLPRVPGAVCPSVFAPRSPFFCCCCWFPAVRAALGRGASHSHWTASCDRSERPPPHVRLPALILRGAPHAHPRPRERAFLTPVRDRVVFKCVRAFMSAQSDRTVSHRHVLRGSHHVCAPQNGDTSGSSQLTNPRARLFATLMLFSDAQDGPDVVQGQPPSRTSYVVALSLDFISHPPRFDPPPKKIYKLPTNDPRVTLPGLTRAAEVKGRLAPLSARDWRCRRSPGMCLTRLGV